MKPMLAATLDDVKDVVFPVYASPKLDGVRALVTRDGKLVSRSLKTFPNPHVNKLFAKKAYAGFDGELIIGPATAKDVFRATSGALQRDDGEPDVAFHVFDQWNRDVPFRDWWHGTKALKRHPIVTVPQALVTNVEDLLELEESALTNGYEGLILRSPGSGYKFGRSTAKQGWLLKLKRFTDSEAEVFGIAEELHNANEAKTNALGRTERSSHQSGMVPTGRMGALLVRDLVSGVEFSVGTGFTAKDREEFWKLRGTELKTFVIGEDKVEAWVPKEKVIIKYKSFAVGVKDKPRFPVFLGRREAFDR